MNRFHLLLLLGLGCAALAPDVRAQEPADGDEEEKRVQYQLVLPEEKTPENVKPEEHNPFESESEAQSRQAPGDTEENRVRDVLTKLPVVGTKRMPDGRMRVLLGNIILETGKVVPAVLPDQLVELKVKNITTDYIELAWQEKRATGLPPSVMTIPINISPRIRYQMLGQSGEQPSKGSTNATMQMPLRGLIAEPVATESSPPASESKRAPLNAEVLMDDPPPPTALPAPEENIEAGAPPVKKAKAEVAAEPTRQPTAPSLPDPTAPSMAQPAAILSTQPTPEMPALNATPEEAAPPVAAPGQPPANAQSPAVESVVRMLFGNPPPAVPAPK